MKQVTINKPFAVNVPSNGGGRVAVKTDASGQRKINVYLLEIKKGSGKDPRIELCGQDGMLYLEDFSAGSVVELVLKEDGEPLAGFQGNICSTQTFRELIDLSYEDLFQKFTARNCLVVDQSFFTRGYTQIEIAKRMRSTQNTDLSNVYDMFSGIGFGAIVAAWLATGGSLAEIGVWWDTKLKKAMKGGLTMLRTGRRSEKTVKKAIKKLFRVNGRDLTFSDLHKDLFIPYMDISGKTIAFRKEGHENTPLYIAVLGSVLDPDLFNTSPVVSRWNGYKFGISAGAFVKSPRKFIQKNNPAIVCTEIRTPARVYDHSQVKKSIAAVSGIYKEISFRTEEVQTGNTIFHTAKPTDEVRKIDLRKKAIKQAIKSGQNGY